MEFGVVGEVGEGVVVGGERSARGMELVMRSVGRRGAGGEEGFGRVGGGGGGGRDWAAAAR